MLPTLNAAGIFSADTLLGSEPPQARPLWLQALLFGVVFLLLQTSYGALRGTWVERLVIDTLTVKTAAWSIRTITPEIAVQAVGTRLKAPGGGINIINGCEGTEVLFLLCAAFVSVSLPWRARLIGVLAGSLLVFFLNQGRILALFYSYRSDKALFDLLHGTVAPLLLIALSTLFFMYWLERYGVSNAAHKPT